MAEIEKKYADYQNSECEAFEKDGPQPIDSKLCPTCQPDPNFQLEANWWELEEAYLNGKECEYHVRVYEREKAVTQDSPVFQSRSELEEKIKSIAAGRILVDNDKPLNNGTRTQVQNACYIKDTYRDLRSAELGEAYLIAVPAFNFDQIPPEDEQDEDDENDNEVSSEEIILNTEKLFRKLRQLRLTLKTYGIYYRSAQQVGNGFVIRQEADETRRIDFDITAKNLKKFTDELNTVLKNQGFAKLNHAGYFKRKRAEKIKIIFKDSGTPFDVKAIYALPDDGCGRYEKLKIKSSNPIRKPRMKPVYNFLRNLDSVINDITAKETKPWLEFTTEHFYPEYVVDYGGIGSIDNARAGLECLLQDQLGIGNGQIIDSLAKEIVSAFNGLEKQMSEEICRAIKAKNPNPSPTELAEQRAAQNSSPKEERERAMKSRYEKEFENKAYKQLVKAVNDHYESFNGIRQEIANKKNVFKEIERIGWEVGLVRENRHLISVDYVVDGNTFSYMFKVHNVETMESGKRGFADTKFAALEGGSFGNQIQNSPHFQEAMDAAREELDNPENTFLQSFKKAEEGESELSTEDMVSALGVCGMSKVAGKALECLAGGVSFDRFLGILIDKAFDFMEVNTLSLFLNGLPADFRQELNEEIERQFGNVRLSDLVELKKAENPNQKMKDFIASKQVAKNILNIYKSKWVDGGVSIFRNSLSDTDKELIDNSLGPFTGGGILGSGSWNKVYDAMVDMGWDSETKTFLRSEDEEGNVYRRKPGSKREERKAIQPEKFVLSLIKYLKREHKKSQNSFRQAMNRIGSAVGSALDNAQAGLSSFQRDRNNLNNAIEAQESLIAAEREILKSIMTDDLFNEDGLVQNFTAVLTPEEKSALMKESAKRVGDYRASLLELEEQLDGLAKDRVKKEIKELMDRVEYLADEGSIGEGLLAIEDLFEKSKQSARQALSSAGTAISNAVDQTFITSDEPEDLDKFSKSMESFKETSLGVKVDAVFDIIFDFVIDYIIDYFGIDALLSRLQQYPIVDFVAGLIDKNLGSCETAPVIYPPPGDFLKSLSVDVCDPTLSLTLPKVNIPNINLRYKLEAQFGEIFREAIIKLVSEIAIKILKKLLATLEGSLCNLLEAAGGFVADGLKNGFSDLNNSFFNALNEAFCNDGENPETAEARAKELADALFSPILFDSGADYEGAGARVANVISSVASTDEFLEAMVARDGQENDQFNKRIANAVNALTPEMAVLLGDPSQVAYFFKNLGSYLTPEDRDRIRDLLDAGIPNLPLSPALCLTNDQLNEWNDFRNNLLRDQGLTPEQAADRVRDLNDKTEKALEDIFDTVGDLDTDGPFVGSLTNEMMKDVCNPNNVVNAESQSDFDRQQEDELTEAFFDNIERSLKNGFFGKGGILAEALKDKEDRREIFRGLFKRFNGNYTNSQVERDNKYSAKNKFGKFLMDLQTENGEAIGVYPETVAIQQRKQIVEEAAQEFKFNNEGRNITDYTFFDSSDDFEYKLRIRSVNSALPKDSFDYRMRVDEFSYEAGLFGGDEDNDNVVSFRTPVEVSEAEMQYFRSQGFQLTTNQEKDVRKELFTKIVQNKVSINDSLASNLYKQMFENINKNLSTGLLTDDTDSNGIPVGYKFGYKSDDLTKDSFKYTPSDEEGKLGTFASSRIKPLDPKIYGGSYKRPAYYVEPRQFFGWVEVGTKAFGTEDGCDPKRPPLFDMSDVKNRVKNLGSSLREDPRLSKDPDCAIEKPFHLLLDRKNKAKLDGVIRTTIRTYLGEYFIKGYGLFSNLQIRPDNFDQSMMLYIVNKMKREMEDLGAFGSNKKVRIVRERYWYTFLEQSVEAYQRMIDVDGLTPPDDVLDALNKIQIGIDKYRPVTTKTRKRMRKAIKDNGSIRKPSKNYDSVNVASQSNFDFTLQSVAFRLSSQEEREDFFNGELFTDVNASDIRFASLKKLNFFKKIYFIKVFEKEAILIMSELIRDELSRLALNVVDGISDKPRYYDLHRSFFGMSSFFPGSSSRVGTNVFYTDKQRGIINTGMIPEIKVNNATSPLAPSDKPQLVLESFARLEARPDAPAFIRNRQEKYTGLISLGNLRNFINDNLSLMEDSNLSDFFGNLSFVYETTIKSLFDKGFANEESVRRLVELNRDKGALFVSGINQAFVSYISNQEFEDVKVTYDESFVLDGEDPTPTGTIGSTGVKYGMRLSVLLPSSMGSQIQQTTDLLIKSRLERAYFFQDGGVMIPLVTSEIDVKDSRVEEFDPFSGSEPYDLECLINKMVDSIEFQVIMDKVFNFKQTASMLAIYCMESLPAAIGRDESERNEVDEDPDVDDWDRVVNKFGKNFLRREFKSLYLANHPDGQSDDNDDDSERSRRMRLGNPLDFFALPSVKLPWWLKRRMRLNVYDANGQECADPKKDLQ